jgi:hypothetical protein
MIVYQSSALEFRNAVDTNKITLEIVDLFEKKLGKAVGEGERRSWNNSLRFMESIVRNSKVADDCGVLIEYTIPTTSKRIDFIITGKNEIGDSNFILIELKQWESASDTDKLNLVKSFVGGSVRELTHPSYQAWSYKQFLKDMNEAIYTQKIKGHSCVYLHNYRESIPEPLKHNKYSQVLSEAPLYFAEDYRKLQEFLFRYVGKGDGLDILYGIEHGKIKPSKKLTTYISSIFEGNKEFVLIDEQQVAYANILKAVKEDDKKTTIIVKGGPGTGKSVISLNVFADLINEQKNILFIAPNASFRNVILEKLTKSKTKSKIRVAPLFSGSGKFWNSKMDEFDVLVVDEAHRLKQKGAYMYKGDNQVDDIIFASKTNVFFIDDFQRIRPDDVGSVEEIKKFANEYGSKIIEIELSAQFRCSGADGFINWIDNTFQIREKANSD